MLTPDGAVWITSHFFAKKKRSGWVVISIALAAIGGVAALAYVITAIMPVLLLMFIWGGVNATKDQAPEPAMVAYKDRISDAVHTFHPSPQWAQLSNEVRFARECDFYKGYGDCTMYEGSWDTHTPYHKGMESEFLTAFAGAATMQELPTKDLSGVMVDHAFFEINGVPFNLSVKPSGNGEDAVIHVTSKTNEGYIPSK